MISADTLDDLEVNNLTLFEPKMKQYFTNKVQSFKGGQLANFLDEWKTITSDSLIIDVIYQKRVRVFHWGFQTREN